MRCWQNCCLAPWQHWAASEAQSQEVLCVVGVVAEAPGEGHMRVLWMLQRRRLRPRLSLPASTRWRLAWSEAAAQAG